MSDDTLSAAALLDRIDLGRDDSEIVRTISLMFKAPDYQELLSSFQDEATRHPSGKATKFVNVLEKARASPSPCLVHAVEFT
jgi:hypothetical protein